MTAAAMVELATWVARVTAKCRRPWELIIADNFRAPAVVRISGPPDRSSLQARADEVGRIPADATLDDAKRSVAAMLAGADGLHTEHSGPIQPDGGVGARKLSGSFARDPGEAN